ncbi:alpha/beta fold hydrolase [Cellulomonas sp. 179-A 4D5 NHS]|uniref:alpha/beta fold hydrolase n=1 Tax=Cellulomonas sp. 179-A 4D5 NHS TaxID=3142378 RepID=UPI0039A05228
MTDVLPEAGEPVDEVGRPGLGAGAGLRADDGLPRAVPPSRADALLAGDDARALHRGAPRVTTNPRRTTVTLGSEAEVVATELGAPGTRGPTLVLVHGIGVSGRYFAPLADVLARDHDVLVPDLPGFGRSPRGGQRPTIEDLAATLRDYLRAAELDRPVLVGHSMGAQVVVEAMRQAPGAARRGVCIGTVIDSRARNPVRQALRLARDGLHEPLRANAIITSDYLRAGPRWYTAMLRPMLGYATEEAAAQVSDELLFVRGEKDPICTRRWQAELAAAAPRGRSAEVAGAGHVAMYTHPEDVAALVLGEVP